MASVDLSDDSEFGKFWLIETLDSTKKNQEQPDSPGVLAGEDQYNSYSAFAQFDQELAYIPR